jgi:hypothetical protein
MTIDYQSLIKNAPPGTESEAIVYLAEQLPYLWRDAYQASTALVTNIMRIRHGSFEYIYDDYETLEATGVVPKHPTAESRLVAVFGTSQAQAQAKGRNDGRLRGWVGPTETRFGAAWDKGHFIAHSMGGAVDGVEANVFVQSRALNRGWSEAGKRYLSPNV